MNQQMLFTIKTTLLSSNLPHFLGTNILMLVYKWLNILPTILSTAKKFHFFFGVKMKDRVIQKKRRSEPTMKWLSTTCYKNSQSLPVINQQWMHVMSLYYHWLCHYQNVELFFPHSCTVHLDTIESFIYLTDAQLDCSKNVKIYIKIYMRCAATCFDFSHPSSGSYCMCFAKVISINNQLKYVDYRMCSV